MYCELMVVQLTWLLLEPHIWHLRAVHNARVFVQLTALHELALQMLPITPKAALLVHLECQV